MSRGGQEQPRPGVGVHHRGDAHGDHRHPPGCPGPRALRRLPTPEPGTSPAIRQLHRGAQAGAVPGGQGVHGDHRRRAHPLHGSPHQLQGLQPRPGQHPGTHRRHRPEIRKLPGHGPDHVPGHQQVVYGRRANGVAGHGPVSQARRQHRPLRQQRRQLPCQAPGLPGRNSPPPGGNTAPGPTVTYRPTGLPRAWAPSSSSTRMSVTA